MVAVGLQKGRELANHVLLNVRLPLVVVPIAIVTACILRRGMGNRQKSNNKAASDCHTRTKDAPHESSTYQVRINSSEQYKSAV